jgi:hypothetical protein
MSQMESSTFVLVHGAWHGGWCWKKLTPLLKAAGHDVFTPTLTGLGERAHLLARRSAWTPILPTSQPYWTMKICAT